MRIDRMLAITIQLLNRERVTARQLAEKFEVSVRTIYRDIEAIGLAGIPIMSYPGNEGGYCLIDNFKIDRQFLTIKEIFSVLAALKGLNITLEDKQLDLAMQKIKSLVPTKKSNDIDYFIEPIVFDILPWGKGEKQKILFKEIHKAIGESRLIRFVYTNNKGERLNRTVEPMTILFKGYGWYLFAFCRERKDYRFFRLSRIRDLEIVEEKFQRRKKSFHDIELPDFRKKGTQKALFKFSVKVKQWVQNYFENEHIEILENGDLLVEATLPDEKWVYGMILSYGNEIEVLEPQSLRNEIKEISKKIYLKYQT